MKPLVLTLRARPDQRLDLAPLVPHRLAGMAAAEIERVEVQTTRRRVLLADIFHLRMGDVAQIRIEGACDRLDRIGHEMTSGEIVAEGDIGAQAGRLMTGGSLTVHGSVGPWAGSGMKGGTIDILGDADERLGGPIAGEIAGMRGGVVRVRGSVGERVGDRMRRGTIVVEGDAGAYAGSRMIAGTLVVVGRSGPLPGYLMKRGTIVLGKKAVRLSPTFIDCGVHDLIAARLMAAFIGSYSTRAAKLLSRPLRRFAGDMAALGKGEILLRA
ncbi:MAG TPA: formylmethanofuran dehydrogenase subunit C [Xanthobacteraceae bacterium]|nr:formylmethanofuran dehydrogenase subunit C [Xanthobacteraceae bacterium]